MTAPSFRNNGITGGHRPPLHGQIDPPSCGTAGTGAAGTAGVADAAPSSFPRYPGSSTPTFFASSCSGGTAPASPERNPAVLPLPSAPLPLSQTVSLSILRFAIALTCA